MKAIERPHPDPGALLRFARGEVSSAERKAIVAHLLCRCEECAATVREEAGLTDPFHTERKEQREQRWN
jgi:anti-sigma factor ChrR (cupin superfamily)